MALMTTPLVNFTFGLTLLSVEVMERGEESRGEVKRGEVRRGEERIGE